VLGAGALGLFLPLCVGLTDGGFYGRASTPLTVAFGAIVGLAVLTNVAARPSVSALAMLALLATLAAWIALSSVWAVRGGLVEQDARRALVYACAFGAVVSVVGRTRGAALLQGLTAGIAAIALVAIAIRAGSAESPDRFYGTLAEEPVGYPNALGVLMAIGTVLATGLRLYGGSSRRVLQGLSAVLVLVLGLTESRGAALALGCGLVLFACLGPGGERARDTLRALLPVVIGALGWVALIWVGSGGTRLLAGAMATFAAAAAMPGLDRVRPRVALVALACGALAVGLALATTRPVSTTSSFRTAYWAAALEGARAHPMLGTGAGTFHLTWLEHGPSGVFVRDAHSLYVEALSELGPVGLLLVVSTVAVPLVATVRRRGDPVVAVAGAAFVVFAVHAGLDWDWEMPVVTLIALGCAGAVLGGSSTAAKEERA
jgi:O-antigen ligase